MKRLNYYKLLIIPALILLALLTSFCTVRESQVDSQEVAEEKNKEKFTSKESERDAQLVTDAVASILAQIRLADMALSKSRDEEVERIALELKNDCTKILASLTKYAAEKVITVPLTESNEARKTTQKLQNESDQFNKKWCEEMHTINKDFIAILEKGKENVTDSQLTYWIDTALPVIRKNLDQVSASHNRLK